MTRIRRASKAACSFNTILRFRIYHCPADQSTIETRDGTKLTQPRLRSYNLSQSVNGFSL